MTILPSLSLLNEISQFIQKERNFSLNYGLFLLSWKSGLRVSEAVSFDYQLKHPRYKNLYLVHGKGQKKRYVYVGKEIIQKLKSQNWKPNQTNRINFYHFLQKIKWEMNIPANVELTPHTLRRCFTTYRALNGVPMPILQKALGHKNIRTTSYYWKGSVDIREFGEWLEDDFSSEPETFHKENPNSKETELLKVIEELKGELAEKDQQLAEYKERLKQLETKTKPLIENSTNLENATEKPNKSKRKSELEISLKDNNFLLDSLSKIKKLSNNPLAVKEKEQGELIAEIQVWKPPN